MCTCFVSFAVLGLGLSLVTAGLGYNTAYFALIPSPKAEFLRGGVHYEQRVSNNLCFHRVV